VEVTPYPSAAYVKLSAETLIITWPLVARGHPVGDLAVRI
jgi:hypothetical protein